MSSATPSVRETSEQSESTVLVRIDFERGWNRDGDTADAVLRRSAYRWHADIKRTDGGGFALIGTRWDASDMQVTIEAVMSALSVLQEWFNRRNAAISALMPYLGPDQWRAGASTDDATWAALAHIYQTLVSEGTHDVVEILGDLMEAPSRDSVATRLRRARSKGFLTASTQGVVAGAATDRAQQCLPWSWTWPQG